MTIHHPDAEISLEELDSDKLRIEVQPNDESYFVPKATCDTGYPIELIQSILNKVSPAYLCDEILRDESPDYIRKGLQYDVLGYLNETEVNGKRILELGCGCGSSTANLVRMFPDSEIVGVELEEDNLTIARQRAGYHRFSNVTFMVSPSPNELPPNIGQFDVVMLNAVYEHLLPEERSTIIALLWKHLRPNGVMFVRETPYRYFHREGHTTGLRFINYLPAKLAHLVAVRYSPRNLAGSDWQQLLRRGIRGGSAHEVMNHLKHCDGKASLLSPKAFGAQDRIDLAFCKRFNATDIEAVHGQLGKGYRLRKLFKALTGIQYLGELTLAIRKN